MVGKKVAIVERMGKKQLVVIHGPMYSGKTRRLVEEYGDGIGVVAFRPAIDERYGQEPRMYSKDGMSSPAIKVSHEKPEQILKELKYKRGVKKVIIDEVSFFPTTPFLQVISKLLKSNKQVVVAGLAYDAYQKEWGAIVALTKWEGVREVELTARCDAPSCKRPAIWSYHKREVTGRLVVAADSLYGACCDKHYGVLHVGERA